MYFESVFIKPNNFYINIYNINLWKKMQLVVSTGYNSTQS